MRTKFKQWAVDYLNEGKNILYLKNENDIKDFVNSKECFLEIGPGKGQFILNIAKKYPQFNFLVVEINKTVAGIALKKIDEENLSNVKLIAEDFYKLIDVIKENSISGIFLNFSDPRPKKRHEKRRLTSSPFIESYLKILKDNHNIYFKSDNYNFYLYSLDKFKEYGFDILKNDTNYNDDEDFDALTEFETRYKNEGIKINRLILKKGSNIKMNKLNELEKKYFEELTQKDAISGNEKEVAHYLALEYKKLGLELYKDYAGNIYGIKKGSDSSVKVMIDAHMDEVGFIVKDIKENGLITPYPLGGFNYQTLLSNRVKLTTKNGEKFVGAIDSTPPHLLKGQAQEVNASNLLFDFGFLSKEDAIANHVEIGDMITLVGEFKYLNHETRILSKALDDRYGLILGLSVLNELKDVTLPFDLYVGGSTQEEVGLRGLPSAIKNINPDFCFVLDCSTAKDSISPNEYGRIGDGVLLRFVDRTMIANSELLSFQKEAVINTNGKYQYFETLGGTNASVPFSSNCLTLTHCIVARSIHTASSIMDINDFIYAKNSLLYMLKNLSKEKILEIKESKY